MTEPLQAVRFGEVGELFVRPNEIAKGQPHLGHSHFIDHVSHVTQGRVRVDAKDPATGEMHSAEFGEGDYFVVKAEWWHTFSALTDLAKWVCVFVKPERFLLDAPYHAERE